MNETVRYAVVDHVATITLDRPERHNAINGAMREGLNAAWETFRGDEDAWVAILTGTGDCFCAGADLVDGAGSTGTFAGTFWEIPTVNSFESGMELWKPTIAAVNGPCVGYGLTGVLACDFVLASDRASFSFPEVRLGVPTIVGAIRAAGRLRWDHAMELLLTGERFDAAWAHEVGLTTRVVPHDTLLAEANALAARLTVGAPLAVRTVKEMAARGRTLPWTDAVRFGETMRRVTGATEDAREGRLAWAEKRPPEWRGR